MNEAQAIAVEKLKGSTEYFSVSELAELLNLHPATIRSWRTQDRLKTARKDPHDARKWLVEGDEVAQLLTRTPSLGYGHRGSKEARRDMQAAEAEPRPQETGARALGTGLLGRGLS